MCRYINFNNLRKKKKFAGGGVVVGWSLPLWKQKTTKKIQKEGRENRKNNLLFEQ